MYFSSLVTECYVWPVRVPDPLDIAHFSTSCYRMLLCNQSISWSLRHSTFQYVLLQNDTVWPVRVPDPLDTTHFSVYFLQNAIVWPVRVPDPFDTTHFSMSRYRMLLCDQSVSLIPYTQHISVCIVTECYCVKNPCPWFLRQSTFHYVVLQNAKSVNSTCPWSLRHSAFPYHTWIQRPSSQRHLQHRTHSITRHTTPRDRYGATFRC
jgi:hypothetical protein